MILYDQPDIAGAGQVKVHTGVVPGSEWNTLTSKPYVVLPHSKNHFHLPVAMAFDFSTTVSNVALNQFVYLTTEFNYLNGTGYIAYIANAFGLFITPTTGNSGIYRMLFETDTAFTGGFFAKNTLGLTSADLILTASSDDPSAVMPDVPYSLLYYTWKP